MIANDIQRILELLNSQDTYLDQSLNHNGDLASLSTWQQEIAYLITGQNQPLFSQFHNWYSSDHTLYSQLQALKSAIESLASASPPSVNVAVTNVVGDTHVVVTNVLGDTTIIVTNVVASGSSFSPDILAGNPWWATNSNFVATWDAWNLKNPHPRLLQGTSFSFPEMLSMILGQRTLGYDYNDGDISSFQEYYSAFGADPDYNAINWGGQGLTWYDWIADAWKSNFVADASYNRLLLNALANLSNEVNTTGEYLVNRLSASSDDTNFYLSNLVNVATAISPDILAGNPWWATNSSFAGVYEAFQQVAPGVKPYQFLQNGTFPQVFSAYLSMRQKQARPSSPFQNLNLYDLWGNDGDNFTRHEVWTFEDWLAEYLKSNMVLTTASSSTQLLQDVLAYDTSDDPNPTNTPLPEYSLPESESIAGAEETLTDTQSSIEEKIQGLQPHYTAGDDEIVVIPAFSVGGINVSEYRARLGTTITPVCRSVASFIWYVGLFAFLFSFAKAEFVYYATLGKFWVKVV